MIDRTLVILEEQSIGILLLGTMKYQVNHLMHLFVQAMAVTGFGSINYTGFISIIKSLIISHILAFSEGYIMFTIFKHVFKNLNLAKTNRNLRRVQAFAHRTNEVQKSMAIITMVIVSSGLAKPVDITFEVQVSCAIDMALGTLVGGWKIDYENKIY